MTAERIVDGLYQINLGMVNCFFGVGPDGRLVLVDTGTSGNADRIQGAIEGAGYRIDQVDAIVLTHLHADHVGSASELKHRTGAQVYAHHQDAVLIQRGVAARPMKPGPGLFLKLMVPVISVFSPKRCEPVVVEHEVAHGTELDVGGGFVVVHTPGHTEGHISLVWKTTPVLLAADAAANIRGLRPPLVWEDERDSLASIRLLADLGIEIAVFGHGRPLMDGAAQALAEL